MGGDSESCQTEKLHVALLVLYLTHFMPIFHFYTPCKRQKTRCFLTFSECKEITKKVIDTRLGKVKSHCWCYSVQEEYKQVLSGAE